MRICFFFKQKTAYEMRISDWSSDVCSSDLPLVGLRRARDLHRQVVLAPLPQGLRHLERVGREVALRVTEVGAVEPHVALVEEPVEGPPGASAVGGSGRFQPSPVDERAVAVGEGRLGPPVPAPPHALPRPALPLTSEDWPVSEEGGK